MSSFPKIIFHALFPFPLFIQWCFTTVFLIFANAFHFGPNFAASFKIPIVGAACNAILVADGAGKTLVPALTTAFTHAVLAVAIIGAVKGMGTRPIDQGAGDYNHEKYWKGAHLKCFE